jgi:serine protease inhibitor
MFSNLQPRKGVLWVHMLKMSINLRYLKSKPMKRIFVYLTVTVLFMSLNSCGDQSSNENGPPVLRSITAEEVVIIDASNNFSFDLFRRISIMHPDENLFISPLSVSTALSMTANGAVGNTKDMIKEALHQEGVSDLEINEAYSTLDEFLTRLDPKVIVQLANSNWYRQEFAINADFENILQEYYQADVRSADFDDPATKDLINEWIENQTNGKIKDMIQEIAPGTVMYLINAIYLDAAWKYRFDESKTANGQFALLDGTAVETEMMYAESIEANAYFGSDFDYVEIPYGNGQFVFGILLPKDLSEFHAVINDFDMEVLSDILNEATMGNYEVYLPKFKIEFKLSLKTVLAAMGMAGCFSGDADFSDMFEDELSLAISEIMHQSFIEVNEEGTEAAAATVVTMELTTALPKVIYANKPFGILYKGKTL